MWGPLARLAHIRAVLAAPLWLEASPVRAHALRSGGPNGASAPPDRLARPSGTCPTPRSTGPAPTPAPIPARYEPSKSTDRQIARPNHRDHGRALRGPARYAQVIYLTAPPARPVVTRSAGTVPADWQNRIVIRTCPRPRTPQNRRHNRHVLAQAHRQPVAAPQDGQGYRVAAALPAGRRAMVPHSRDSGQIPGRVEAVTGEDDS